MSAVLFDRRHSAVQFGCRKKNEITAKFQKTFDIGLAPKMRRMDIWVNSVEL